jgi:hypothetical protein
MKPEIQGQLLSAVKNGGADALWNVARGKGPMAKTALEVIELATSPFHDISIYQAINIICEKKR